VGDRGWLWRTGPIWLSSERPLAKFVGRPVAKFLRVEAAAGIVLLVAAIVALVWANAWPESYEAVWHTELAVRLGPWELMRDLREWVNDGLMVLFFLVVGLEIKYELVEGELRDPRAAAVPIMAAAGGMIVPAAIYVAFNAGGPGMAGWGIPMATDIAFALGVVALLGRRIPAPARVFLLTLAIVDDIGAVLVIGVFYSHGFSAGWLTAAMVAMAAMVVMRRLRVWSLYPYLLAGGFVWLATEVSGVHAAIAGVAIGLLTPARPLLHERRARRYARRIVPARMDAENVRRLQFLFGESVSVAQRLQHALHPWSAFLVLPIFALANAGVDLDAGVLAQAATSPVTLGILFGLVIGKPVGVLVTTWLAVRLGLGRLPGGTNWGMITGLAAVAGIGFTVSLFITGLAFPGQDLAQADARIGILAGSLIAAVFGGLTLLNSTRRRAVATDPLARPES
jgi:Na+:H+ antiporter, NhaA family